MRADLHGGGLLGHPDQGSGTAPGGCCSLAYWWMRARQHVIAVLALPAGRGAALIGCGGAGVGASGHPSKAADRPAAGARRTGRRRRPRRGARHAPRGGAGVAKEVADPAGTSSYPAPGLGAPQAAAAPAHGRRRGRRGGSALRRRSAQGARADARGRTGARCRRSSSQLTPVPGGESIGGNGTIPIPADVPEVVQKVIAGANEIADFPYVYGGGHASFVDNAYDCSGSVSYALAAGGLLSAPETSGDTRELGRAGTRALHHRVRKRRPHLHVRRRHAVRHRRAQRRVCLALAGRSRRTTPATSCATGPGL